jgi:hypothetical protein
MGDNLAESGQADGKVGRTTGIGGDGVCASRAAGVERLGGCKLEFG